MLDICGKKVVMTYNGRTVMADTATRLCWLTTSNVLPDRADGVQFDCYSHGDDFVLIGWTQENTAPYVAVNGNQLRGACSLAEARRFMESRA